MEGEGCPRPDNGSAAGRCGARRPGGAVRDTPQLRRSSRVAPAATVVARTQPSRISAVENHCQPPRSCQKPSWPRLITGSSRSREKSAGFQFGCSPGLIAGWSACENATALTAHSTAIQTAARSGR